MSLADLKNEISAYMPFDDFIRIQQRLVQLQKDEEDKLKALAELQQAFLSATTDNEMEMVKKTVAEIREISRATREEKRALINELQKHMTMEMAKNFYSRVLQGGL